MTANLNTFPTVLISNYCKLNQVQELSLFGSAARGELTVESDLDILVEFAPEANIGFMTLGRMARELSEILGRNVDLVPKDGLKPLLRSAVLAEAKVLFAA